MTADIDHASELQLVPELAPEDASPRCTVIGPWFYLTVTVELENDRPEVHLHPGGQGFWIARIMATLGCDAHLVAPVGGEAGTVLEALVPGWEIELDAVAIAAHSPTQVHDRRTGERESIIEAEAVQLDRHEADDLYGTALRSALASGAVILTAAPSGALPDDAYGRLVADLADKGVLICADMHGAALDAALAGGRLDLLKVSEDDLAADGWDVGSEAQAVAAARELQGRGAATVVISRAGDPAVAALDGRVVRVRPPTLSEVDHRGAGDSMSGAMAAGHLFGLGPADAVRLGAAAGAGNVTRRGLGTGSPELIEQLSELVVIEDLT